jgi:hypothetical protein
VWLSGPSSLRELVSELAFGDITLRAQKKRRGGWERSLFMGRVESRHRATVEEFQPLLQFVSKSKIKHFIIQLVYACSSDDQPRHVRREVKDTRLTLYLE